MARWAIRVTWEDGSDEYVQCGPQVAVYPSKERAEKDREFLLMSGDFDSRSVAVVHAPTRAGA